MGYVAIVVEVGEWIAAFGGSFRSVVVVSIVDGGHKSWLALLLERSGEVLALEDEIMEH